VVPSFDETLTTGEDTDFAFRATQAGCEVVALPSLRVTHLGEPSTLRQYYRQQLWHANRKAYGTILKSSGGKSGANAIYFSFAFLAALLLAILGLLLAWLFTPWALFLLAPLAAVTVVPAALIADRANSPVLFFRLIVLYFLYGLARSVDLVGLSPRKKSWKS
jgi:GT2 family glycosyltransferase